MLKNPTETLQRSVWAGPNLEYRFNSSDDVIQGCKVAVVKTAAPNQLPHAFNRVKFRAVGREKMQAKMTCNFPAPRLMQAGVVITGVVDDHYHFSAGAALQFPIEIPASACVKHAVGSGHDQLAVFEAHCAEKADALARRGVETNWIVHFGRNPHATTRAVLLKMDFIHRPQIDVSPSRQCVKFFYARPAKAGRIWPLADAACASESQAGGKVADIGALLISLPVPDPETQITLDHPTTASSARTLPDWRATLPPPLPVGCHPDGWAVRDVDLRLIRPARRFRNVAPSSRRCGGSRPAVAPPGDTSSPEPRAKRRGVDDHSATHRCAESHLESP